VTKNQENDRGAHEREKGPIIAQPVGRVVHQVWVQGNPAGEPLALMDKVKAMCAAERRAYFRWRESREVAGRFVVCEAGYVLDSDLYARHVHHCPNYSVRSDLMRFVILHRLGGLYLDADVDLRALPSPDLVGAWIMCMDEPPAKPASVNCAVTAGPPGHPYFARLLARVERQPTVLEHPYAGMGMAIQELTGHGDVNLWPYDAWNDVRHTQWGVRPGRYGTHLYRAVKWGSQQRIA
jgi:mannosyltransferase OCH1-like enzyme